MTPPHDDREEPPSIPPRHASRPEVHATLNFNEMVLTSLDKLEKALSYQSNKQDERHHALERRLDTLVKYDDTHRSAIVNLTDKFTGLDKRLTVAETRLTSVNDKADKALVRTSDTKDALEGTLAAVSLNTNAVAEKTEAVASECRAQTTSLTSLKAVNELQNEAIKETAQKVDTTAAKIDTTAQKVDATGAKIDAVTTVITTMR